MADMVDMVRMALRRTTKAFDPEIAALIDACLCELQGLGVIADASAPVSDSQIHLAVIAYCKWQFGENPDADKWEHIYTDKVKMLQSRSGYGLPGGGNG